MQMIASYLPVKAKVRAADGISKAPGTRAISISLGIAPDRSSPSQALSSSRSVMNAFKPRHHNGKPLAGGVELPFKRPKLRLRHPLNLQFVFLCDLCVLCGEWLLVLIRENLRKSVAKAYFPLNAAARFSRNAVVPSVLSSVAQHTPNKTASR